mgnify:CR=1 FL=1
MTIGILKEPTGERRVSLLPEQCEAFIKKNINLVIEHDAGMNAAASNAAYEARGVKLFSRKEALQQADIILSIHPLSNHDITDAKPSAIITGVYQPLFSFNTIKEWAAKNFTIFSMDMLPRTTRAQSMDVLSSQANIAGYKAVLTAANVYPRYFPMFMTAAGSIAPAKVLILGAGVAGLQVKVVARAVREVGLVDLVDGQCVRSFVDQGQVGPAARHDRAVSDDRVAPLTTDRQRPAARGCSVGNPGAPSGERARPSVR